MKRQIRVKNIPASYDKLASPAISPRVSVGMEERIKEYFQINVEDILPYEKQARKVFDEDEIDKLAETIKAHGIRQPLTVVKANTPGKFHVISGERRLRAAKKAELKTVPCILINDANNLEEIALIENIQREDLHPIELAAAYSSLLSKYEYGDITSLGKRIGRTKSHISETLSYNNIPQEIKDFLLQKNIKSRAFLRKLIQSHDIQSMKELLGIEAKIKPREKNKSLVKIYVKGGNINVEMTKIKIDEIQRKELKRELQKLLESLN